MSTTLDQGEELGKTGKARWRAVDVSARHLADLQALYEKGLYLQAYQQALSHGPLEHWQGEAACLLAGRLLQMVGNPRLCAIMHYRGWRCYPQSSELFFYYARQHVRRNGVYLTRRLLQRHADLVMQEGPTRASWLAFEAYLDSVYRDFERADASIAQAIALDPEDPWLRVEQSTVLEHQDNYEQALSCLDVALRHQPFYRPAVQQKAYLLQLMGRDQEALDLLIEATQQVESDAINAQLLAIQLENKDYAAARKTLVRIDELTPRKDREYRKWFACRSSDVAFFCGDEREAITQARAGKHPFYTAIADNLEAAGDAGEGVLLEVEFVRQHHTTCGPATLSALTRYLGREAAHDQIVASIWYSGTSDYSERRWALENAWVVREFCATWDSAKALLDRGLAFALSTVDPGNAHLQAVVGYNPRRGVLLIRDPYNRFYQEFLAKPFFERYGASGPRAMVLIEPHKAAALAGLELPQEAHYDAYYRLQDALERHDRDAGEAVLAELEQTAPDARMSIMARRTLAFYDADETAILAATRALLKMYPEEINYQLSEIQSLRNLGRLAEREALLQERSMAADAHPLLQTPYVDVLADDSRRYQQARELLEPVLRRQPTQSSAYASLAHLQWGRREFEAATQSYRIAASLDDKDEAYVLDYFKAARWVRQAETALRWLQDRYQRFGDLSGLPAITLYKAYELLDRDHEGLALLDKAIERRADDGDLLLYGAHIATQNARLERARELITRAQDKVRRSRVLSAWAQFYETQRELPKALLHWHQVVEQEPQNLFAHRRIASLLSDIKGRSAALAHVEALGKRFAHNHDVYELWLDWVDDSDAAGAAAILRKVIELNPTHAWAHRQLAIKLTEQGELDAGFAQLALAAQLDPYNVGLYQIRGDFYIRQGAREKALEDYREAIRLSVDSQYAISQLLDYAYSNQEKREALEFVRRELVKQVTHGDGLLIYQRYASEILPPEELLDQLKQAWQARADLWHSWSALVNQYYQLGLLDEGITCAQQMCERFPLLPRVWLDLAQGHRLKGDWSAEREPLRSALQINPHWEKAIVRLAENYEHAGDYPASRDLLLAAKRKNSGNAQLCAYLADVQWRLDEKDNALASICEAVEYTPDYNWAWEKLQAWSAHSQDPDLPVRTARELAQRHPGSAQIKLALARLLGPTEEALVLLQEVIAQHPGINEAIELRVQLLARLERFEEAREQISAPALPVALRGHGPWLTMREGKLEQAVVELKCLLKEEPTYASGWRMLADWCERLERVQEVLDASRHYAELLPNEALAHIYLGDALCEAGEKREAKIEYARVLTLSPDHSYAAVSLFDLQLEDHALDAAQETLSLAQQHADADYVPYLLAREIKLCTVLDDSERAEKALIILCEQAMDGAWPINTAVRALMEKPWHDILSRVLEPALLTQGADKGVLGSAWAQWKKTADNWALSDERIDQLLAAGDAGVQGVDAYLDYLHEKTQTRRLDRLLRKHAKALRRIDATWATIGYIHANRGDYKKAVGWMHDWQSREQMPAWAFNNLAISLREIHDWALAYTVVQQALNLEPNEHTHTFALWAALEAGVRGDEAALQDYAQNVHNNELSLCNEYAYHLLLALKVFFERPAQERRQGLGQVREALRAALAVYPAYREDRSVSGMRDRVVSMMASSLGGFVLSYWYRWRLL